MDGWRKRYHTWPSDREFDILKEQAKEAAYCLLPSCPGMKAYAKLVAEIFWDEFYKRYRKPEFMRSYEQTEEEYKVAMNA